MKKIIYTFVTFCLILASCFSALAKTDISNVFDSVDEIKSIENEILESINIDFPLFLDEMITSDDINYNNVLRTYNGTKILENSNVTEENIVQLVESSEYDYEIFLEIDNVYPRLTIVKGKELPEEKKHLFNEEEIKQIENEVGKWIVQSNGTHENKTLFQYHKENLVKFLENSDKTFSKLHVICSLSGNLPCVAMLVTENSEIEFLILAGTVNDKEINYNNPDNTLYSLDEIKQIAAQFVPVETDLLDGIEPVSRPSNNKPIIIAAFSGGAVIVLAAVVAAVIIVKKKHKKAETEA